MNLREFYEEVGRILPGTSYCVDVEAWKYTSSVEVTWKVFDGSHSHEGATPEEALAKLRSCIAALAVPAVDVAGIIPEPEPAPEATECATADDEVAF